MAGGEAIGQQKGENVARCHAFRKLGTLFLGTGDFKRALEYFNLDHAVARESQDRSREGWNLCSIGTCYRILGDSTRTIEFQLSAQSIGKEIEDKLLEGASYCELGLLYRFLGHCKRAIELLVLAVNVYKDARDKTREAMALCNLASVYNSLGEFKKSNDIHYDALSTFEDIGDKVSEGKTYGNLGINFSSLGNFNKAIEFLQQALDIAKEHKDRHSEGMAYLNLGNSYNSLGDFKRAIKFHRQALVIAKEIGSKAFEGQAYGGLGNDYLSLLDFEKAFEFQQLALDTFKVIGAKGSEAISYTDLGNVYRSLGDFKQAIVCYQQSLKIAKAVGDEDLEAKASNNLGIVYRSNGDSEKATELYQRTISISGRDGDKVAEAVAYGNVGSVYNSLGDKDLAEHTLKTSVKLFDEARDLLLSKDEWKISLRNQYNDVYNALWMVQLNQKKMVEALFTAERARAQALMDLFELHYGLKSTQLVHDNTIDTVAVISRYISSPTVFIAVAFKSVNFWVLHKGTDEYQFGEKQVDDLQDLIDEAYKEIGVFESVMCENRSLYETEDHHESEVWRNESPEDKEAMHSAGESNALKALYDVAFGPIAHLIRSNDVIIVPDGPLLLVPYAALMDQDSRYLSETQRIRLVPSLTSLKLMAECPESFHSTFGALLVGDPWVENVRIGRKRVKQLPSARKEVEMIGTILEIAPLTGKEAAKAEVLKRLSSVALVHIAAHGCPETGEIILSPNPSPRKRPKEEDFLLTMGDVLQAKLKARLVVLSCCHSGRGKVKAEGVVGIARAFLGAGARSVLVSLWAIHDEATLAFMKVFYQHLIEGQSASISLNLAMSWMRKSQKHCAVKYWAPFALIGDDVILDFQQSRSAYGYVAFHAGVFRRVVFFYYAETGE